MTRWQIESSSGRIAVGGELRTADAAAIWRSLRHHVRRLGRGGPIEIDLAQASMIDGTVMALLIELRAGLAKDGVSAEITGASGRIAGVVHLYGGDQRPGRVTEPDHARAIARLGVGVAKTATEVRRLVEFGGELVRGIAAVLRRPRLGGWRDLGALVAQTGADGVPIVLVLDFLVGFVMAFQSTRQLETYGANLYVADIVGICRQMMDELGHANPEWK